MKVMEKATWKSQHGKVNKCDFPFIKGKSHLINFINFYDDENASLIDKERALDVFYLGFRKAFKAVCWKISIERK